MHFSSPSGHRLSWWRSWNRGAVGFCTSGYSTVSTFWNICLKVTPNPLTGLRKSGTGDLLRGVGDGGFPGAARCGRATDDGRGDPGAVIVRQVQRGHREGPAGTGCPAPDRASAVGGGLVRRRVLAVGHGGLLPGRG